MLESARKGVFELGEDGLGELVKRVREVEGEDTFVGRREEEYNVKECEGESGGRN